MCVFMIVNSYVIIIHTFPLSFISRTLIHAIYFVVMDFFRLQFPFVHLIPVSLCVLIWRNQSIARLLIRGKGGLWSMRQLLFLEGVQSNEYFN